MAATLLSILGPIERSGAQNLIHVNNASQTIPSGGCNLREAIYAANFDSNIAIQSTDPDIFVATGCAAGTGDDTIVLPAGLELPFNSIVDDAHNPFGPTGTPIVFSNITIEANGARLVRLDGDKHFRAFAVGYASIDLPDGTTMSGYGNLTIANAHIKDFSAVGGEGRCGGGGGLGAGGAIFVGIDAALTLKNSTLEGNGAIGGNAHAGTTELCRLGGGGGMGGSGGNGSTTGADSATGAGGGGGGSRGSGGDAFLDQGGSGGGTVTSGGPDYVGFKCGGAGGEGGEDGDDASCAGGGGGGGGETGIVFGGVPGAGGFGGGGGGGGFNETIGKDGGAGGFGGGGGSCGGWGRFIATNGGSGGFGGGGGSCIEDPGGGGLYGGRADKARGGGGAGLGGAIFSSPYGTVTVLNSTFTGNFAVRGAPLCGPAMSECGDAGSGTAANGADAGGAIFSYQSSLTVINSTITRNASTGAFGGIAVDNRPNPGDNLGPPFTVFRLHNTIIAHNGVGFNAPDECVIRGSLPPTLVGSGNLIMQNASAGACPGVVAADDPQLLSLRINEPGSTPTMAILVGSPAHDAGDAGTALSTDQRGVARPQLGGIDIGAYEARAPSFSLSVIPTLSIDVGGFGSVAVTVDSFENFNAPVMLTVAPPPPGITASLAPNAVTPPANGSASSTLTVSLGPLVTAGSYTPMVIGTSSGFSFSAPAVVTVSATAAGIMNVIGAMKATGCIDNAGIVNSLNSKLAAAGAFATAGDLRPAASMLSALINEVDAQTSKHITPSCAAALINNLQALGADWAGQ